MKRPTRSQVADNLVMVAGIVLVVLIILAGWGMAYSLSVIQRAAEDCTADGGSFRHYSSECVHPQPIPTPVPMPVPEMERPYWDCATPGPTMGTAGFRFECVNP